MALRPKGDPMGLTPDSAIRSARRRGRLLIALAVLISAGSVVALGVSDAATSTDAVAVTDPMVRELTSAAASCSVLTPARLAGQVMAATGFKPQAAGGIGGLTAAQWRVWAPRAGASPSDTSASLLALAHMTCDAIGQVRVADLPGDRWQLAVAALNTSMAAVTSARGIPSAVAAYVTRVDDYATFYAGQTAFGGRPPIVTAAVAPPVPSATASPTVVAPTTAPAASPTAPVAPTPPSSPSPTTPAPSPAAPTVHIAYSSFADASQLRLNGSAHVTGGQLDLAAGSQQGGSAWSTSTIDVSHSFTTSFVASISDITDGLAFVVRSPSSIPLGQFGGGLGYGGRPSDNGPMIKSSLAVELDTWDNSPDGFDPAGHQHIAVLTNGDVTRHLAWADPGFSLWGSTPTHVWITYNASAHSITAYAGQTATRPAKALFSYSINLEQVVGAGRAVVGFTGGTGLTNITDAQESISSWSLTEG